MFFFLVGEVKNLSSTATFQLIDNFERSFSFDPWFPRGGRISPLDLDLFHMQIRVINVATGRDNWTGQIYCRLP